MKAAVSRLCLIALLFQAIAAPAWQQGIVPAVEKVPERASAPWLLKDGTEIPLKFAQSLSTKSAVIGDKVEFVVAEDVRVGGNVAVPAGTRVLGTVITGKQSEKKKNDADALAVRAEYLKVAGMRVKLRSDKIDPQKAKVDKGKVVAATIFFGVSGLVFALGSKRLVIPEGTPVMAYVAEDVTLAPAPQH